MTKNHNKDDQKYDNIDTNDDNDNKIWMTTMTKIMTMIAKCDDNDDKKDDNKHDNKI